MHTLNTRINTAILIVIALTGFVLVAMLASRAYGGPLDPPGAPAPTQPNLIYQPASCAGFPIVLSARGSYRLASNITGCAGKDGIQITSGLISLDLAGFSVIGVPGSLIGIKSVGPIGPLAVSDGLIHAWGQTGLDLGSSGPNHIDNIVSGYNTGDGIVLGGSSALSRSTASANTGNGIVFGAGATNTTITECNVNYNGGGGIIGPGANGVTVRACSIGSNSGGGGIDLGAFARITNNIVHHNGGNGISAQHSCMIDDNSSEANALTGFVVSAPGNCTLVGNKSTANAVGFDIFEGGGYSLIEDNHASGNGGNGFYVGTANPGYPNIVKGNSASANGVNYSIGANNDAAPTVTASSATNPISNISN